MWQTSGSRLPESVSPPPPPVPSPSHTSHSFFTFYFYHLFITCFGDKDSCGWIWPWTSDLPTTTRNCSPVSLYLACVALGINPRTCWANRLPSDQHPSSTSSVWETPEGNIGSHSEFSFTSYKITLPVKISSARTKRGLENIAHRGLKEPDIFSLEIKSLTCPPPGHVFRRAWGDKPLWRWTSGR